MNCISISNLLVYLSLTLLLQFGFPHKATASEEMVKIFESVWSKTSSKISPGELSQLHFTNDNFNELRKRVSDANFLFELSDIINPFFKKLKISHTQLLTKYDLDYYFFQSLFVSRKIEEPKIYHIGVQYEKDPTGLFRIRSILERYPAELSGFNKGDLILSVEDEPFQPIFSFNSGSERTLKIRRNGKIYLKKVTPVYESLQASFLKAMKQSRRIFSIKGKKIGYLHLWAGTNELFQKELSAAVIGYFKSTDGLILDIRDGYGGAWHSYLDPFYGDRKSFFKATIIQRDGSSSTIDPEPLAPHEYFKKPMVVLINESVRSGKESLAYQFKKTNRATLVGTKTAGYFSTGEINFTEDSRGFLLYVAISQILLDGNQIEGRGIDPDVHVENQISKEIFKDMQLETGLNILASKLK